LIEPVEFFLRLAELIISWQVVLLIFIYLFRMEIRIILTNLLNGLKRISAMGCEIEFEPVIKDTRLGKTEISKVSVFEGIQCEYINRLYNYKISWPSKRWEAVIGTEEIKEKFLGVPDANIQIAIFMKDEERSEIYDFSNNINLIVVPIGNLSLKEFARIGIEKLKQNKFKLKEFSIDDKTGGAFCTLIQKRDGSEYLQFQRYVVDSGNAYVLTRTVKKIDDSRLDGEVQRELMAIINSFRIITYD
jgi:hypothetical protein